MKFLSHPIIRALFFVTLLSIVFVIAVLQWMKYYTHHGEKLTLPDYVDKPLESAMHHAEENSFEIVVTDSIFLVDIPGGLIQSQKPIAGSQVKRGRKIYVVISKTEADMVSVSSLPRLYGERYDLKKRELEKAFEISSEVVDRKYDPGLPEMILEVRHDGKTIVDAEGRKDNHEVPKGGTLEFVLSQRSGGEFQVPELLCSTYEEAKFLIDQSRFVLGDRTTDGTVTELTRSYVYRQVPGYEEGLKLPQGDTIHLFLTSEIPDNCQ